MKKFDGIELLRKYRDGEIDYNTKIKSLSATGNEYYMYIGRGADKILYEDGKPVSTGYLTNVDNEFEIIEEETKDDFTGCKWFVRGKETMSMDYEDSENWFKAKELIESLSSIEKTEEEKDIEEINEIIRFQDLATPYGHNEQMFMKFLIIHQNKIDELVKKVNKLNKEEK